MEISVKTEWTIGQLIELKNEQILRVNHEYQRGLRWTDIQKRMFIDSIFRGYSIPAFYFHKRHVSTIQIQNTHFDIVDGQQRVDAIHSYSEGGYALIDSSVETGFHFPNFVRDMPCPWGGKRFNELSEELQDKLKNHEVVVYEIVTDNENFVRDLFIRLQGGTPLSPQDKRDSWPGNFTDFILRIGGKSGIERYPGLPLFMETAKVANESRRRHLAAQVFMLFWTVRNDTKFCDIKSSIIDEFYHSQVDFDEKSSEAQRFEHICKLLYNAMPPGFRVAAHHLIHMFLFVDSLLDEYAHGWEQNLAKSLVEFEARCKQTYTDIQNGQETEDERYYTGYALLTRTQSDVASTIRRRHALFSEKMLEILSPTQLDPVRSFSDLERKIVFFRDMEICQWCKMKGSEIKVSWEECEIHHVIPHAQGGPTNIGNAALVHRDYHPKRNADVVEFQKWWYPLQLAGIPVEIPDNSNREFPPPDGTKARFEYRNKTYRGKIQDGKFLLGGEGTHGITYNSFSAASRAVTGTSRNGWRDWQLKLPGRDTWVLANEWRLGG